MHVASVIVRHVEIRRSLRRQFLVLLRPTALDVAVEDLDPAVPIVAGHLVKETCKISSQAVSET